MVGKSEKENEFLSKNKNILKNRKKLELFIKNRGRVRISRKNGFGWSVI